MTQNLLGNLGEEYIVDNAPNGSSHDYGLYLDSTDGLTETMRLSGITTEPTNTNYARQTSTVTTAQLSGNYGYDNDSKLTFDFSDQTASQNVDTAFDVTSFQSSINGDGSATNHILGNPALSQTRDIGAIDTLEVAAGNASVTID